MLATQNRILIQEYFDTVTGKCVDYSLDNILAENVTWHLPQLAPAIDPGPYIGRSAVIEFFERVKMFFQPGTINITLHKLIADEYDVSVQLTLSAILTNGEHYERQYYFAFSIRDGLIESVHEHIDKQHVIN